MTVLSLMVVYIVQSFHQPLTQLHIQSYLNFIQSLLHTQSSDFAVLYGTVLHETLCIKRNWFRLPVHENGLMKCSV